MGCKLFLEQTPHWCPQIAESKCGWVCLQSKHIRSVDSCESQLHCRFVSEQLAVPHTSGWSMSPSCRSLSIQHQELLHMDSGWTVGWSHFTERKWDPRVSSWTPEPTAAPPSFLPPSIPDPLPQASAPKERRKEIKTNQTSVMTPCEPSTPGFSTALQIRPVHFPLCRGNTAAPKDRKSPSLLRWLPVGDSARLH